MNALSAGLRGYDPDLRGKIAFGSETMAQDHYIVMTVIVMTVECSICKAKQKVHVAGRTGCGQLIDQTIQCIRCNNYVNVTVPDKVIRGPFPV